MPIENFLPVDLLMDLCILCAVQRSLGRIRPMRLAAALVCMLSFTLLTCLANMPATPLTCASACLLSAALLTGERSLRTCLGAAAGIAACSFCAAGLAYAVPGVWTTRLCAALIGAGLTGILLRRRRNIYLRQHIEIYVELCGRRARFHALVDTGNCLREPVSGLPVLIVEAAHIAAPAEAAWLERFDQMRHVSYGALGGGGSCACFRPDRIQLRIPGGDMVPAPDCWIAVYPGRMPGNICALAPPEFAEAIGP